MSWLEDFAEGFAEGFVPVYTNRMARKEENDREDLRLRQVKWEETQKERDAERKKVKQAEALASQFGVDPGMVIQQMDIYGDAGEVSKVLTEALKAGAIVPVKPTESPLNSSVDVSGASPDRKQTAAMVFNSFKAAGFSDTQARALSAEINRENSFNDKYLYGTHTDAANSATNVGMLSWQGDRANKLLSFMSERGLVDESGRIKPGQESLNAQAEYLRWEMENDPTYATTRDTFLNNPDIDAETAHSVLGKNFIRWRIDDPQYRDSGFNRINEGYALLDTAPVDNSTDNQMASLLGVNSAEDARRSNSKFDEYLKSVGEYEDYYAGDNPAVPQATSRIDFSKLTQGTVDLNELVGKSPAEIQQWMLANQNKISANDTDTIKTMYEISLADSQGSDKKLPDLTSVTSSDQVRAVEAQIKAFGLEVPPAYAEALSARGIEIAAAEEAKVQDEQTKAPFNDTFYMFVPDENGKYASRPVPVQSNGFVYRNSSTGEIIEPAKDQQSVFVPVEEVENFTKFANEGINTLQEKANNTFRLTRDALSLRQLIIDRPEATNPFLSVLANINSTLNEGFAAYNFLDPSKTYTYEQAVGALEKVRGLSQDQKEMERYKLTLTFGLLGGLGSTGIGVSDKELKAAANTVSVSGDPVSAVGLINNFIKDSLSTYEAERKFETNSWSFVNDHSKAFWNKPIEEFFAGAGLLNEAQLLQLEEVKAGKTDYFSKVTDGEKGAANASSIYNANKSVFDTAISQLGQVTDPAERQKIINSVAQSVGVDPATVQSTVDVFGSSTGTAPAEQPAPQQAPTGGKVVTEAMAAQNPALSAFIGKTVRPVPDGKGGYTLEEVK